MGGGLINQENTLQIGRLHIKEKSFTKSCYHQVHVNLQRLNQVKNKSGGGEEFCCVCWSQILWAGYYCLLCLLLLTDTLFKILLSSLICTSITMSQPAGLKLWFSDIIHIPRWTTYLFLFSFQASLLPLVTVKGILQTSLVFGHLSNLFLNYYSVPHHFIQCLHSIIIFPYLIQ